MWPAFWMYGPDWPNSGAITIIQGVNNKPYNKVTLHTNTGCAFSNVNADFTGKWDLGENGILVLKIAKMRHCTFFCNTSVWFCLGCFVFFCVESKSLAYTQHKTKHMHEWNV